MEQMSPRLICQTFPAPTKVQKRASELKNMITQATASLRFHIWQHTFSRYTIRTQHTLSRSPELLLQNFRRNFFTSRRNAAKRPSFKLMQKIEKDALAHPQDAQIQLRYLREMNRDNPTMVLRRFEDNTFIRNNEINKEYMKALVTSGKIDAIDTTLNLAPAAASSISSKSSSGQSAAAPLYIAMADGGMKAQMWKFARSIGVVLFFVSALALIADEKGVAKQITGGRSSSVAVAKGSDKRFTDVKGVDEAKAELEEIVSYLRDPTKFTRLGGKLPKGVLLTGPPGTGKTLLARAIAGEAGVPFFYSSGSDFDEMYVGVGARRVRDLFKEAKRKSPCIVFIDEIDAIGATRHLRETPALKMTLNQMLVELDGFDQNNGIIVIGATNFPDVLDSALVRPGRFDRHVNVPLPDIAGRKQILQLHTQPIPLDPDVSIDILARATPGMSGADLMNLVNEAAIRASVQELSHVNMSAFEHAKDKILMGSERRSAVISPESAKLTAYHEGGHALVALNTPGAHPVYKATIMPRGQALGMVSQLPDDDQTSISRKQLLARLDVCMGGRVAEEMIFGHDEVTGGASSDIQQATRIANQMVTRFGMSEEVGLVFHDLKEDNMSPMTRKLIDDEIRKLCDASYQRAKAILNHKRKDLDRLAQALLERETLTGAEIKQLLNN